MPLVVFSAPFIILRNTIRGRRLERRPIVFVMLATMIACVWSLMSGRLVLDARADPHRRLTSSRALAHCLAHAPMPRGSACPSTPRRHRRPNFRRTGRFWIAPDAHVIGRVRLGEDASVWFGSVLRGDNELIDIGARTNIQEGSMLHTDMGFPMTIGADCTIGHHAILHGCTIGENSLVGMGATVLNGARIGANSLVGANALVTEGKEFPDNSLIVGAPAKAIRTLDAQAVERLRRTALHYVRNWKRFAKGLRRLD